MSDRRQLWERRHARGAEPFEWFSREPPSELVALLEELRITEGPAVDLGCGPGVVTAYLADRFRPTVGLDIAFGAVTNARALAASQARSPVFVVAEAPALPLQSGAFAFVFDRGCMRSLPPVAYPRYMGEVSRILRPNGVFELIFYPQVGSAPKLLSRKGMRRAITRTLGMRRPQRKPERSPLELLERLTPASLEMLRLEVITFVSPLTDRAVPLHHAVFRKRP